MEDINEKLANLSPEKRALLIKKLQALKNQNTEGSESNISTKEIIGEDFSFKINSPGNFASIKKQNNQFFDLPDNYIRIKVKAASLNFRDLMIAMNLYPQTPNIPSIMGSDYAGIITEIGKNVVNFKVGDEVIALTAGTFNSKMELVDNAHFCSFINISELQAVHKPQNISFEDASIIPTVFLTSYFAIDKIAQLKRGEKILIHSASGGVGLASIQIANHIGAEIYATAGSSEKRDYLQSIGIKHIFDSRSLDFADEINKITDGNGIDVIVNTLSGEAIDKGLSILNYFGRFLQIDKKDIAQSSKLDLKYFNKGLTFSSIDLSLFLLDAPKLHRIFTEISEHFSKGNFKSINYKKFKIDELPEALTYFSRSKHIGKIVLNF